MSGSKKTRWKFTDSVGKSDGSLLAWGREVERTEYVAKVESTEFAYVELLGSTSSLPIDSVWTSKKMQDKLFPSMYT